MIDRPVEVPVLFFSDELCVGDLSRFYILNIFWVFFFYFPLRRYFIDSYGNVRRTSPKHALKKSSDSTV